MCVCVCAYVCICVCACMRALSARAFVCVCVCVCVCERVYALVINNSLLVSQIQFEKRFYIVTLPFVMIYCKLYGQIVSLFVLIWY